MSKNHKNNKGINSFKLSSKVAEEFESCIIVSILTPEKDIKQGSKIR